MTEPDAAPVLFAVDRGVATITFNRPEAMNALDMATKEALLRAVERADDDAEVRAVVLAGTGRAFCVGQDLRDHVRQMSESLESTWRTVPEHYNPIAHTLATMPKPVVAAVNGVAAGAGASFAFACDFRIVADTAGFNLAFTAIGLCCDSGASWTLPRLVGLAKAKELIMLPRTVPAQEALALGLATEVVHPDEVLDRALTLARRLADGPTVAYGAVRRALAHASSTDLSDALAYEAEMMRATGATEDHAGAVRAFVAKETPTFSGR